jgi:outer membrane protein assembly factor BamB
MNGIHTLLALALIPLSAASAKDWPHFRGPQGTNAAPEAKICTEFPDGGPEVLWRHKTSEGYGGAAISDGKVFVMDRENQEKDVLLCLNLEDGKELWRWEHEVPGRIPHPGSRVVPTVTEDAVYTSSGFGHVYCIDRKTHKARWILDVAETFSVQPPRFGYSIHPVIINDFCIIAPTSDKVGVAALDKATGKPLWTTEPVGESHSSPILVKILGQDMLVMPGSDGGTLILSGFDPKEGKRLFLYKEELSGRRHNAIPNIAVVSEDTVVATGGYGQGTQVLKFSKDGDDIKAEKIGNIAAGATIHPALKVGEQAYLTVSGGGRGRGRRGRGGRPNAGQPPANQPPAGLICIDHEGKVLWSTGQTPGFGEGSLILAGDTIISQDGGDGTLRLIKPGEKYEQLAEAKVFAEDPGRELWAPLALSEGHLVMRSQAEVVCVDLSPKEE